MFSDLLFLSVSFPLMLMFWNIISGPGDTPNRLLVDIRSLLHREIVPVCTARQIL